ncbi:IS481 family transposase IS1121 [Propionicimonas sp. T2.31MG-18]|uniref:IS481 family transposase n=1 Tax=Propionicimonas sp. T2.31MG-18 TaxID=3157620 RepID=UPI0035EA1F22
MSQCRAHLTVFGRRLLVQRVIEQGWPVAHAAKAQGVSRQCAHRWINRWKAAGEAGLMDRSSRPHHSPRRTSVEVEARIITVRSQERRGQDWLGPELGIPARTVSRVLRRHQLPYLHELDPITGILIRASKTTGVRYEHDHPGSLVHTDVKKLGRIPAGGGWKLHGRQAGDTAAHKNAKTGYDYIHSLVDDHSRYAYSEVLPDEKGATTANFLTRALDHFASVGITVERLISDNHYSYRRSNDVRNLLAERGITHKFIRPHSPWQNGKVERFNRTLQAEWAYAQPFTTNTDRADALAPWLNYYNTERRHTALGGHPPINRLSPT